MAERVEGVKMKSAGTETGGLVLVGDLLAMDTNIVAVATETWDEVCKHVGSAPVGDDGVVPMDGYDDEANQIPVLAQLGNLLSDDTAQDMLIEMNRAAGGRSVMPSPGELIAFQDGAGIVLLALTRYLLGQSGVETPEGGQPNPEA